MSRHALTLMGLCRAEDWICNWVGNKRWVTGLQWSQQDSFNAAEEERWQLDGAIVGSIKEWGPLSFVKIFKAGHMVRQHRVPRNSAASRLLLADSAGLVEILCHVCKSWCLCTLQVPMDQPAAALEMITSFTHGRPLQRVTATSHVTAPRPHGLVKEAHQLRVSSMIAQ